LQLQAAQDGGCQAPFATPDVEPQRIVGREPAAQLFGSVAAIVVDDDDFGRESSQAQNVEQRRQQPLQVVVLAQRRDDDGSVECRTHFAFVPGRLVTSTGSAVDSTT
jgi:hypothetical protein